MKKKLIINNPQQLVFFSDEKILFYTIKEIFRKKINNIVCNVCYFPPMSIKKVVENFKFRFNKKLKIEYYKQKDIKKLKFIKDKKVNNLFIKQINFMGRYLKKIYRK